MALTADADIKGGVVAAQVGTIQAGYVAESGATLLEFATPDETVAAVRNGEADAVFADKDYLAPIAAESGGELVLSGDEVQLGGGVGMGLRESDTELKAKFDAAIQSMKDDGTLNAHDQEVVRRRGHDVLIRRSSGAPGPGPGAPPGALMFVRLRRSVGPRGPDLAACYLTTGKHIDFYWSFLIVLILLAVTAPIALAFGFGGAMAARSPVLPLRLLGKGYTAMVRGVPDIVFFLFFVIALDQGIEWTDASGRLPRLDRADPAGAGIPRLPARPRCRSATRRRSGIRLYGFALAVFTFAIVFGAFAANVLYGAMQAVPRAQLETAESLWHVAAAGLPPHPGAADVGLCPARPVEPVDDPDQGDAASVPAGRPGHRLLGARTGRVQDQRLRLSAPRLAAVLLPRAAGLLPLHDEACPKSSWAA